MSVLRLDLRVNYFGVKPGLFQGIAAIRSETHGEHIKCYKREYYNYEFHLFILPAL